MSYNIAVVGATGNVGREMLKVLAEQNFPVNEVYALASAKSKGKKVSFGDIDLEVQDLDQFDFANVDIALFSAGSEVSAQYARDAAEHCIVIDNTSYFRMHDDVPLIVPEVNGEALSRYQESNIIANPNCAAAQLLMVLKPLHDVAPIKRIVMTTMQSVSGAGKKAMDELFDQTKAKYMNANVEPRAFSKQISFNLIPQIGDFQDDGITGEEQKIEDEVHKILDPNIQVTATCVRVPVFLGHSESVNIEFDSPITEEQVRNILEGTDGIVVSDDIRTKTFTTPIECVGVDDVFVSRIRQDKTVDFGINLWIVADNLRKGAALNAVQIAQELVKNYL